MKSVLFVCVHNAGRSQIAAGYARAFGGDTLAVFSGGSQPADQINPQAVEVMREDGIDIAGAEPRLIAESTVLAADVVITMGCGDACTVFPGKRYEDWKVEDPAGQSIEKVRQIRDDIKSRVQVLLESLNLDSSDA